MTSDAASKAASQEPRPVENEGTAEDTPQPNREAAQCKLAGPNQGKQSEVFWRQMFEEIGVRKKVAPPPPKTWKDRVACEQHQRGFSWEGELLPGHKYAGDPIGIESTLAVLNCIRCSVLLRYVLKRLLAHLCFPFAGVAVIFLAAFLASQVCYSANL